MGGRLSKDVDENAIPKATQGILKQLLKGVDENAIPKFH